MRKRRRSALAAVLVGMVLAGIVSSSAATLGGLTPGTLSAGRATTQRITGVSLDWTPVASGSGWAADAVTLTTDADQSFRTGDLIRLTIVRHGATCEPTATAASGTSVRIGRSALAQACGTIAFSDVDSIAVSITGDGLATTFSSGLGDVHGTLAAFSGTVVDPNRTLSATIGTSKVGGVAQLDKLTVDVTASGITAADLAGSTMIARFRHTDTQAVFERSGTVSLDSSAPIHVVSTSKGSVTIAVTGDPIKLSEVSRFSLVLSTAQHLGSRRPATGGEHAISMTAGSIEGGGNELPPVPSVSTALEPIDLDPRLSYRYTEPSNFDSSTLSFCHNFTVTNTSAKPVNWTLTFDTSLVPLWGFDPTAANAFSSAWNWETVSYDKSTHLWTIRGTGGTRVAQPGATVDSMGYCVQNVPVPPVDPATFSSTVAVSSSSNDYWVQLSLSVTSASHWNRPWEITIDLADYVCPSGLQGASLQWHSGVQVTKLDGNRYTLRGVSGTNTRFVSASRPVSISPLLGYGPTGNKYKLPCAGTRTAARSAVLPETPVAEPTTTPTEPAVAEPTPAQPASAEPTVAEPAATEPATVKAVAPAGVATPAEPATGPSTDSVEAPEPTGAGG